MKKSLERVFERPRRHTSAQAPVRGFIRVVARPQPLATTRPSKMPRPSSRRRPRPHLRVMKRSGRGSSATRTRRSSPFASSTAAAAASSGRDGVSRRVDSSPDEPLGQRGRELLPRPRNGAVAPATRSARESRPATSCPASPRRHLAASVTQYQRCTRALDPLDPVKADQSGAHLTAEAVAPDPFGVGGFGRRYRSRSPASLRSCLLASSSLGSVFCHNSSASAASWVVNGPVGGLRPPSSRSTKVRQRFIRERIDRCSGDHLGAYCHPGPDEPKVGTLLSSDGGPEGGPWRVSDYG